MPWIHVPIAVIAAHRGQLEVARAHSERALQLGEEQFGVHTPVHLGTLGVVALQGGDPHAALDWFDESEATTTRAKLGVRSRAELARTFRLDEQSSGGLAITS